jgi:hypothetical protein
MEHRHHGTAMPGLAAWIQAAGVAAGECPGCIIRRRALAASPAADVSFMLQSSATSGVLHALRAFSKRHDLGNPQLVCEYAATTYGFQPAHLLNTIPRTLVLVHPQPDFMAKPLPAPCILQSFSTPICSST